MAMTATSTIRAALLPLTNPAPAPSWHCGQCGHHFSQAEANLNKRVAWDAVLGQERRAVHCPRCRGMRCAYCLHATRARSTLDARFVVCGHCGLALGRAAADASSVVPAAIHQVAAGAPTRKGADDPCQAILSIHQPSRT